MGHKSDLSAFQRGMVVGARRAGLSISDTAELLGFSRTTISRVYREWSEKDKTSSERQVCGRKSLVDDRGLRRMARLVQADRKATITQLTSRYNQGIQKSISERTTRRTLKQMGYSKQKTTQASKTPQDATPVSKEPDAEAAIPTDEPQMNDNDTPRSASRQEDSEASLFTGRRGFTNAQVPPTEAVEPISKSLNIPDTALVKQDWALQPFTGTTVNTGSSPKQGTQVCCKD